MRMRGPNKSLKWSSSKIKELRQIYKASNMSVAEFGKRHNMTRQQMWMYIGGYVPPKNMTYKIASIVKRRYHAGGTSLRKLAKRYNVSHQTIFLIVNGCVWIKD